LGTQAGLLTQALEAAILLMVIGTTFLAPVLLRLVLGGQNKEPELDPLAEIPT
ncbi:MAG: cation:proton antiporter, partial [Prochlorococcaceae cyanobacterium]